MTICPTVHALPLENRLQLTPVPCRQVVEVDTPLALMEREGSLFRQMMAHTGITTVEQFKQLQNSRSQEGI